MPELIEKVAAYITRGEQLLVFSQPAAPEVGVQVPAGTVEPAEDLRKAVLREAEEETGLHDLEIVAYLGQHSATFADEREGTTTIRRHFFHLRCNGEASERWQHWEMTPSGGVEGPILFELWWTPLAGAQAHLSPWFAVLLDRVII